MGFLETEHGVVETPCLVPVATQAVVKTLDSKEVEETKSQILISNTFWLHLRPRLRQGFGGQAGRGVTSPLHPRSVDCERITACHALRDLHVGR